MIEREAGNRRQAPAKPMIPLSPKKVGKQIKIRIRIVIKISKS